MHRLSALPEGVWVGSFPPNYRDLRDIHWENLANASLPRLLIWSRQATDVENWGHVVKIQKAIILKKPDFLANAYFELGVAHRNMGNFEEAVEGFFQAYALAPEDDRRKYRFALNNAESQREAKKIGRYDIFQISDLIEIAEEAERRCDWATVISIRLAQTEKNFRDGVRPQIFLMSLIIIANAFEKMGKLEEALRYAETIVQLNPVERDDNQRRIERLKRKLQAKGK